MKKIWVWTRSRDSFFDLPRDVLAIFGGILPKLAPRCAKSHPRCAKMVPGWASWAQLVPSWRDLGSKFGGFGEHFGGTFGHRREFKIRQRYNVLAIFLVFRGVLAAMFFKVARRWRQEGSKIQDFRPSRRSWRPSWRQEGSNFFSKTRPESRGAGKVPAPCEAGGGGVADERGGER